MQSKLLVALAGAALLALAAPAAADNPSFSIPNAELEALASSAGDTADASALAAQGAVQGVSTAITEAAGAVQNGEVPIDNLAAARDAVLGAAGQVVDGAAGLALDAVGTAQGIAVGKVDEANATANAAQGFGVDTIGAAGGLGHATLAAACEQPLQVPPSGTCSDGSVANAARIAGDQVIDAAGAAALSADAGATVGAVDALVRGVVALPQSG